MRTHAKASTAGPTQRQASIARPGLISLACLAAISLLTLLAGATPALGAVVTDRPLLFSFDGADTSAGAFTDVRALEIDQVSGTVYVIDQGHNVLNKFNLSGEAQNFSATASSSLAPGFSFNFLSDVAVDNSATHPGRIHVMREFGPVKAYNPAGESLWEITGFPDVCGLAVDTDGRPWVGDWSNVKAREYANTGAPPVETGSIPVTAGRPCRLDVDASGNLYINRSSEGVDKYVGGVKGPTIDPAVSKGVTVDQSSAAGHVFTLHSADFNEYDSTGALVGTFGGVAISNGEGIAYEEDLDRVYVADGTSDTVKVFGPAVTATVPDATIEATSEVGVSKAKFNGKVNPQGVPNSYHFEWKQGTGSSWSGAKSSAPQSLPEDSADHPVSFNVTGLAGNTTYQVRLVVTNTGNGLKAISGVDTFTTATAAQAPAMTIEPPAAGTTTAQIDGTVNPREDVSTTWRLQTSTDPACASGFTNGPLHNLSSEASTPVAVAEELTGLLPAAHYCVRISATNSFGTAVSETKEFSTDTAPPSQVFTAFAAPRTDTTARLNGRVNPEGVPFTYHFEYSEDGGSTWISRPELEDTSGARRQIVVADELTGLSPDTTYEYRFVAENGVGPAAPQGEEKSFTTRSTAEMNLPQRGVELINNPDKGNQNVSAGIIDLGASLVLAAGGKPFASDGNSAFWSAPGGIPGGTTGIGSPFIARRTPDGWRSQSLLPAGDQLEGGGDFSFTPIAATPDFSEFILRPGAFLQLPTWWEILRMDLNHNQERLAYYPNAEEEEGLYSGVEMDTSTDLAHVVQIDKASGQVVDIGTGTPEVVSLMPDGSPANCGVEQEGRGFFFGHQTPEEHWIATTDASRVFFLTEDTESCVTGFNAIWSLFVRNRDAGVTTEVAEGITKSIQFVRAAADGRSAILVAKDQLTGSDTNASYDVYQWEEGSGLSCWSCVVADASVLEVGGAAAAVRASADLSHVYFESKNQLVPGMGTQGQVNLYSLSEGAIHFVAETRDNEGGLQDGSAGSRFDSEFPPRLSSDGNILLFSSTRQLTADQLGTGCKTPESAALRPCRAAYRYDDRDGSLECFSCRHGSVTAADIGSLESPDRIAELSADGETVAFTTSAAILPTDVNTGPDVYVWNHGAVGLITDGVTKFPKSGGEPRLVGVDETGANIFFLVAAGKLTGFELDGLTHYYDARIGGGFEPPDPPVHCSGDSCQGPLEEEPPLVGAGSAAFTGRGNVAGTARKRCRRAALRRGKRCVSKRALARRACRKKRGEAKQRCMDKQVKRLSRKQLSEPTNRDAGRGK